MQNDRPQPNSIASITVAGATMTIHMTDGTTLGPLPLPVLTFHWRDAWLPFTLYGPLDTFFVEGAGIFTALAQHTSGALFDPDVLDPNPVVSGAAALKKLFGADAGSALGSAIYDFELIYEGVLSDMDRQINFLALRSFLVPAAGNQLAIYLDEPPSTAQQVFPIQHDGTPIGTATVEIGANVGTVVMLADATIRAGERFSLLPPLVADATAAGLTLAVAAQRLIA